MNLPVIVEDHVAKWAFCRKCPIGEYATNHVFFRGQLPCHVLLIGEAPGREEDMAGEPFVGRSGRTLDQWIATARKAYFSQRGGPPRVVHKLRVAITNTVLCRPRNGREDNKNRAPTPGEKHNCSPRLDEFVDLSMARAVVAVGSHARDRCVQSNWWGRPGYAIRHPMYFGYSGLDPGVEGAKLAEIFQEVMK